MRTTVLVFIDRADPKKGLRVATMKEWDEILSENKGLAMQERRIFCKDCILENDGLDTMYIETTYEEYAKSEAERKAQYRNEQEKKKCSFISLTAQGCFGDDSISLEECIPQYYCLEDEVVDNITIETIRDALARWKPWAPELLDIYMNGQGRECTSYLMHKYGISERLVRKRKMELKEFIKNFLK